MEATITARLSIRELLHPRSVAIVGASGDITKWGGRLLHYMSKHRIAGELYPINPRGEKLMGVQSYPSLADCPKPIDMAILLVPNTRALAAVQDCVANGVGCAVAITAGFSEMGEEGTRLEQELLRTAREGGMRLIGPNCMGLLNTHHNLAATTAVTMGYVDKLPRGVIGMASQSGALLGAMLARGIDVGAGFSTMVSLGNQADIDQNDIFGYLIDDPATEVIALYIEAVKDAPRFIDLLGKARRAGKPVLAVKSGRSEAGGRAVKSHTASLAGAWPSFEALCLSYGVYLFDNVFDLLNAAMQLQRKVRMTAPGVAVFSGSGGGGALFVDALDDVGLTLPALSEKTKENLAGVLPGSHRELPIDFGVINHAAEPDPKYGDAIAAAIGRTMDDESVGAGIVFLTTQPNMDSVSESVLNVGRQLSKPLLFVHGASTVGDVARQVMRESGYGYVESPNDAVKIISALWQRESTPRGAEHGGGSQAPVALPPELGSGYLTEESARRLLESAGVPTTPWRFVTNAEEAVAAARDLASPVAIKGVSPTLVHKSDVGAVKLNVQGEAAVRAACEEISGAMHRSRHTPTGFIVTAMVQADAELIVGIQRDPDFGPMVMVGAGGVLVELLKDVQLRPAPLTHEQAADMLDRLRCRPLLEGWRGRRPVDRQQLVDVLVNLGQLAVSVTGLKELDINPLMVADGQVVAADARAVLDQD